MNDPYLFAPQSKTRRSKAESRLWLMILDLDPDDADKIKQRARTKGLSMEQFITNSLKWSLGIDATDHTQSKRG